MLAIHSQCVRAAVSFEWGKTPVADNSMPLIGEDARPVFQDTVHCLDRYFRPFGQSRARNRLALRQHTVQVQGQPLLYYVEAREASDNVRGQFSKIQF